MNSAPTRKEQLLTLEKRQRGLARVLDLKRTVTNGRREYNLPCVSTSLRPNLSPGMCMAFVESDVVVPSSFIPVGSVVETEDKMTRCDHRMFAGVLADFNYDNDCSDIYGLEPYKCQVLKGIDLLNTLVYEPPMSMYKFGGTIGMGNDGKLCPTTTHSIGWILRPPTEKDPYLEVSLRTIG